MTHIRSRVVLERRVELPEYRLARWQLGLAHARLGNAEEARRIADGGSPLNWAEIYTLIEDYDAAVDLLEQLSGVEVEVTVPLLRFDPLWDPLREHPRFQALLVKYEN